MCSSSLFVPKKLVERALPDVGGAYCLRLAVESETTTSPLTQDIEEKIEPLTLVLSFRGRVDGDASASIRTTSDNVIKRVNDASSKPTFTTYHVPIMRVSSMWTPAKEASLTDCENPTKPSITRSELVSASNGNVLTENKVESKQEKKKESVVVPTDDDAGDALPPIVTYLGKDGLYHSSSSALLDATAFDFGTIIERYSLRSPETHSRSRMFLLW